MKWLSRLFGKLAPSSLTCRFVTTYPEQAAAPRVEPLPPPEGWQGWQPIATAPKDGTPVLVAFGHRRHRFVVVGTYSGSEWYSCCGVDRGPLSNVTDWQSIPKPTIPPAPSADPPQETKP